MYDVLYDFIYNSGNAAGGIAQITLSGLIPGFQYETRIYARQWTQSDFRTATFDFDTDGDGIAEDTIPWINQDDASQTPPSDSTYAANTAYAISYQFTAGGETETISGTWHNYGSSQ